MIIPNYNHAPFLKQRIESVINQTYQNLEVIILDDSSTDESRGVIEQYRAYSQVKCILYNETNSGSPFIQWAKGIELVTGKYVWIAESDDWCELNFLEEIMKYAHKYPEAALIYTDSYIIRGEEKELMGPLIQEDYQYFKPNELIKERLLNGISIYNGSAVVFKKTHAIKHLKELVTYKKHGDYFFWIKVASDSSSMFVNQPLNNFRALTSSVTSLSKNSITSLEEHLKIFTLLRDKLPLLTLTSHHFFFNCWAIQFNKLIKALTGKINHKQWLYKLTFSKPISFYFSYRTLYHYLRS